MIIQQWKIRASEEYLNLKVQNVNKQNTNNITKHSSQSYLFMGGNKLSSWPELYRTEQVSDL